MTTTVEKKAVSKEEFEKRVEMEFDYLVYMEVMKKKEAWEKARKEIESRFVIQ